MTKTIIFSPVRQEPSILNLFLRSLDSLNKGGLSEIWLLDDNDNHESSDLLLNFSKDCSMTKIIKGNKSYESYQKDENTHLWTNQLLERITGIKNNIIRSFVASSYEYLLFCDSDLVLHPETLNKLLSYNLPIISEIFWTKFTSDDFYKPNVWDYHGAGFSSAENMIRLRRPGIYQVGGLGACTLINKEPLLRGVDFSPIPGLKLWGEDRYFSTRASCYGFPLMVDTTYPAFHIYRKSQLEAGAVWFDEGCQPEYFLHLLDNDWENQVTASFTPKKKSSIRKFIRRIFPN